MAKGPTSLSKTNENKRKRKRYTLILNLLLSPRSRIRWRDPQKTNKEASMAITTRRMTLLMVPVLLFTTALSVQMMNSHFLKISSSNMIHPTSGEGYFPLCSLPEYHRYYADSFSNLRIPFDGECLTGLIDEYTNDVSLRVGLVRLRYEQLQATVPKRHIVYFCRHTCGGLGDRLRASLSTFYLSLAMNATFTIDVELPVHWEDFFHGLNHNYETTTVKGGLFHRFNITEHYSEMNVTDFNLLSMIPYDHTSLFRRWNQLDWDYVVDNHWYSNENVENHLFAMGSWHSDAYIHEEHSVMQNESAKESVVLSGMTFRLEPFKNNTYAQDFWRDFRLKDLGRAERTHIFYRLFMPNPTHHLTEAMKIHVDRLKETYVIGIHIRLGGELKGEQEKGIGWDDPVRHGVGCVQCMAEKAREVCNTTLSMYCTIWVASDDPASVDNIKATLVNDTNIQVLVSSGPVTHIDKSFDAGLGHDAREMNTRTFVDWYVMAEYSDAFIISRSGFGEHASWYKMLNATHFKPAFRFKSESPCEFEDYRFIQNRTMEESEY